MVLRMIVGLVLTAAAFAIAGRRLWWLKRLGFSGQPAPERLEYARSHPAGEAETRLTEVVGQRKLLQWTVPGAAHAATFWGFLVLVLTIIEAYGSLFQRTFSIPGMPFGIRKTNSRTSAIRTPPFAAYVFGTRCEPWKPIRLRTSCPSGEAT